MLSDTFPSKYGIFQDPNIESMVVNASCGQVIHQPQTPAEHVYYIQRGEVRLYTVGKNSCRLVTILGAGDWFGTGALARHSNYGMRATAVSPTVLLQARADRFMEVLSRRPEALIDLSRELAARLLSATRDASSLVFDDCNQRLINTLLRFSRSAASTPRDDGVVLHITHDQLAQAVGAARETVSLALTQLRQQNLLKTGRNQLIFNPDLLKQFNTGETVREMQLSA